MERGGAPPRGWGDGNVTIDPLLRISGAALLASQLGCSFFGWGLKRPPSPPVKPDSELACTTGATAPALDTVGALIFTGLGVAGIAVTAGECHGGGDLCGLNDAALGLSVASTVVGLVYGGSAIYGYSAIGECTDLIEWKNACVKGDARACERLYGPPRASPAVKPGAQ